MASIWLSRDECEYPEDLPPVCMVCAEDSETTVRQNLSWYNPLWNLMFLMGLLPWIIVVLIMTKRATLSAPVCDQHRGHFWKHKLVSGLAVFVGIFVCVGFMVAGFAVADQNRQQEWMGFAGVIAGAAGFLVFITVAVIASKRMIRPLEIRDDEVHLTRVAPEFVDEVRAFRRKMRQRRGRDDDDFDDE
jgi:hypothetical protein